jgi:hypothetical protein
LPLLQGLKELSLGEAKRSEDMRLEVGGFRDTLEKFSSRICEDSDIATLANNCKQLKCLDISCSTGVSDRIVGDILTFRHLQDLNLCEVRSLSEDALQHLLSSFAKVDVAEGQADTQRPSVFRSKNFESFGCNNPTDQHFSIISQFSNLTSLALSNAVNCVLTPLRALKHLRNFAVGGFSFLSCSGTADINRKSTADINRKSTALLKHS